MNRRLMMLAAGVILAACRPAQPAIKWVSTTVDNPWQVMEPAVSEDAATVGIVLDPSAVKQTVEGFGTCLNELGWLSLSELSEADCTAILEDLFTPEGAGLTMARMPLGANDFSVDFYSYDQVDGDFALEHFSIDRDRTALIPFIKAAQAVNPDLKIWASPWCPPSWMKTNKHYACRSSRFNDLPEALQIPEGVNGFILEPAYLEAYARYFGKFIDAYKAEGINHFMVMPQNEPNSDQPFPACTWTPEGLIAFLKYLGPEMASRSVDVYLGTMERPDPEMWDKIVNDPEVGQYIKGMGFQWAGKDALPELHRRHPELPCYMTEQECGDGRNDLAGAMHSWDLMKHYLGNGVQGYFYWNTSLLEGGISTWGWRQNSLVVVDKDRKTFRYTPEYYLLKHVSHYVRPGAKVLDLHTTYEDALGFQNPDGRIVLVLANKDESPKTVEISVLGRQPHTSKPPVHPLDLPAQSINTIVL
jgi:glucosylceramidase